MALDAKRPSRIARFTRMVSMATIHGSDNDQTIQGTHASDLIFGAANTETIIGGGGNDTIVGGIGDKNITTGSGNDIVIGGTGDDVVHLGGGRNYFGGSAGNGLGTGNDQIFGGNGHNRGSGLKPSKFPEPWKISSLSERDVCEEDIKVDRLTAVAEHVAPEEVDVPPSHGGDFLQ